MNIVGWLVCIIGGIFGIGLVGGTALGMIGVIIWKIYRYCRYHISLYEYEDSCFKRNDETWS